MLGGTFCNLNESIFLNSLKRVLRQGDVFIVGVGLISLSEQNINAYDNEPVYNMLTSPLRKLGYKIIDNELNTQWVQGEQDIWSTIKNSKTLVFKVKIEISKNKYKHIMIQSVSRYIYDDVIEYIENKNFILKYTSYNNEKDFAYLAFEYQGE